MSDRTRTTALILAGGNGSRLAPTVAPGMKPLREVDGKPLIDHSLEFARQYGCHDVTVVANPFNYEQLLDRARSFNFASVQTCVQAQPKGVVDAIAVGLDMSYGEQLLLLMADNTFDPDGAWFRQHASIPAIAINSNLTNPERYSVVYDGRLHGRGSAFSIKTRWCGPVLLWADDLERYITAASPTMSIETILTVAAHDRFATVIEMNCRDHGVIE